MKRLALSLVAVLLFAANAFADCPTPPSYSLYGSINWTQLPACYSTDNITSLTPTCNDPRWQFGNGWSSIATTSFTIGANDPVADPARWSGESFIEFNSPSASWYDQIELDAYVHHPNGATNSYVLFNWNGTMGNLSGCTQLYGYFSADHGDTITIQLKGTNLSGATITATVPRVFSNLY
jgi:hypothetical protein